MRRCRELVTRIAELFPRRLVSHLCTVFFQAADALSQNIDEVSLQSPQAFSAARYAVIYYVRDPIHTSLVVFTGI